MNTETKIIKFTVGLIKLPEKMALLLLSDSQFLTDPQYGFGRNFI